MPRRRPEPRQPATEVMPRTVPIVSAPPAPPAAPAPARSAARLNWSRSIVDYAQRGEALPQDFHQPSAVPPVRSQAAARARAGLVTPPVTPVISVNPAPPAPELLTPVAAPVHFPEPVFEPAPAPTTWGRLRKNVESLLGLFRQG